MNTFTTSSVQINKINKNLIFSKFKLFKRKVNHSRLKYFIFQVLLAILIDNLFLINQNIPDINSIKVQEQRFTILPHLFQIKINFNLTEINLALGYGQRNLVRDILHDRWSVHGFNLSQVMDIAFFRELQLDFLLWTLLHWSHFKVWFANF